jgi:hypothetical protein
MDRCPKCNRRLQNSQQLRVRGIALVVLGLCLSLGMAYLIWVMAITMRHKVGGPASSFTGTPRDAALIFGILGAVLVFGITSLSTGLWQIAFGRPNRLLSGAVLVLGLVTVVLAVVFSLQR